MMMYKKQEGEASECALNKKGTYECDARDENAKRFDLFAPSSNLSGSVTSTIEN